jgi:hypothetical protein
MKVYTIPYNCWKHHSQGFKATISQYFSHHLWRTFTGRSLVFSRLCG